MSKKKKPHTKGKGKKRPRVVSVSGLLYMPIKVPSPRDAYLQAMAVGLEAANAILPSYLCTNPMLPLAGMLHYLQSYTGQPICSTEGQALGHRSGQPPT